MKLSAASRKMAAGMAKVTATITGPRVLGSMCCHTMLLVLAPLEPGSEHEVALTEREHLAADEACDRRPGDEGHGKDDDDDIIREEGDVALE